MLCYSQRPPILWPSDAKSWLIRKNSDAGTGWRQEEKGTSEDKMVAWHYWLSGHEFEPALGDGEGQGSLVCCSPWGRRVGHDWVTEQQQHSHRAKETLRAWQLTPVFLPGESHGQRSLAGYSPWGHAESDRTLATLHTGIAETLLCQQRSIESRLWFFQWSCMDVRVGL